MKVSRETASSVTAFPDAPPSRSTIPLLPADDTSKTLPTSSLR